LNTLLLPVVAAVLQAGQVAVEVLAGTEQRPDTQFQPGLPTLPLSAAAAQSVLKALHQAGIRARSAAAQRFNLLAVEQHYLGMVDPGGLVAVDMGMAAAVDQPGQVELEIPLALPHHKVTLAGITTIKPASGQPAAAAV
jgi:hypothetical protein